MFGKIREVRGIRERQPDKRERTFTSVNKEDFLMKQIDEFKEKALELQQMLEAKESRMQELSQVVGEREQRALKLQQVLEHKQREADRITKEVEESITLIARNLEGQISRISQNVEQGTEQLSKENDTKMTQVSQQLAGIRTELTEKQDAIKAELAEKVHTENVKSYRNMQTLIEELEGKLDTAEASEKKVKSVKGYLRAAIVIGVLNLLAIAGLFLYELGILDYLM